MLNNFLGEFTRLLNEGMENFIGVALQLMIIFASIDLGLSFLYQYANEFSGIMTTFFKKLINYGMASAFVVGWAKFVKIIVSLIFSLGMTFFGVEGGTEVPNFDGIFDILRLQPLIINQQRDTLHWSEILTGIILIIVILIAFVLIFIILKEIIVRYIEFVIVSAIGVILLPFLVLENTKDFGRKVFTAMLSKGCILLVSIVLSGIVVQIVKDTVAFNEIGENAISVGDAVVYLFKLGLGAYLVTYSESIGSALATGSLSSRGNFGFIGKGMTMVTGAALAGVGMAAGAVGGAVGGIKSGVEAYKGGLRNTKGIGNAIKDGASKGAGAVNNSFVGKVGSRVGRAVNYSVLMGTGQKDILDFTQDFTKASGEIGKDIFDSVSNKLDPDGISNYKSGKSMKDGVNDIKTAYEGATKNGKFDYGKYKEIRKEQKEDSILNRKANKDIEEQAKKILKEERTSGNKKAKLDEIIKNLKNENNNNE